MKIRFLSAQAPSLIGLKRFGVIVRKELHLAWRKDTTYQSTKRYTLVSDLCLRSDSPNDRYSYVFSTVAVGAASRAPKTSVCQNPPVNLGFVRHSKNSNRASHRGLRGDLVSLTCANTSGVWCGTQTDAGPSKSTPACRVADDRIVANALSPRRARRRVSGRH